MSERRLSIMSPLNFWTEIGNNFFEFVILIGLYEKENPCARDFFMIGQPLMFSVFRCPAS